MIRLISAITILEQKGQWYLQKESKNANYKQYSPHQLKLRGNQIEDTGLMYICKAIIEGKLKLTLTSIDLSQNEIGNGGHKYLEKLIDSTPSLKDVVRSPD